jgi:hypothetical protein
MGPIAKKLRARFERYSHAQAVEYGDRWAVEISAGRKGMELLSDEAGKVLEFPSHHSASAYIADTLDGL